MCVCVCVCVCASACTGAARGFSCDAEMSRACTAYACGYARALTSVDPCVCSRVCVVVSFLFNWFAPASRRMCRRAAHKLSPPASPACFTSTRAPLHEPVGAHSAPRHFALAYAPSLPPPLPLNDRLHCTPLSPLCGVASLSVFPSCGCLPFFLFKVSWNASASCGGTERVVCVLPPLCRRRSRPSTAPLLAVCWVNSASGPTPFQRWASPTSHTDCMIPRASDRRAVLATEGGEAPASWRIPRISPIS